MSVVEVVVVIVEVVPFLPVHAVIVVSLSGKVIRFGDNSGNSTNGGIGRSTQDGTGFGGFAVSGTAEARCQTRAHDPVLLLLLLLL